MGELADTLRLFAEYLQKTGSSLFAEAFRIHGVRTLSVQQLRYLEVIEGNPGVSPAELAKKFEVAKPTISNMVAALEGRGLIRAETDSEDRRVKRLWPTTVTSQIFRRRREMYVELAKHIDEKLTQSEIRQMVRLLTKAAHGLGKENG